VRIIAVSTLKAFLRRSQAHADSRDPLMAWARQVKATDWASPAEVKRDIGSARVLKDGRVVFKLAGNKYRIVVWINYPYRVLYIRFVGTHAQYDQIDARCSDYIDGCKAVGNIRSRDRRGPNGDREWT
jgi:mRNA interferase HigB